MTRERCCFEFFIAFFRLLLGHVFLPVAGGAVRTVQGIGLRERLGSVCESTGRGCCVG